MVAFRRSPWFSFPLVVLLAHACSGDEGSVADNQGKGGASGSAGGSAAAAAVSGTGGIGIIDSSQGLVVSLEVQPATATIEVNNGSSSPVQFKAIATFESGGTSEVQADWVFDLPDVALIDKAGVMSAHGTKGGQGTVTATFGDKSASATALIRLRFEKDYANLSQSDKDRFDSPDATASGNLLYPYDQTVFARGILAPELMWSGGGAGDAYKITIASEHVKLTAYASADPPSRWLMEQPWFDALAESSDGSPVQVSVQRADAAGAHAPMTQTWRIAPGSLRGTIYYWAVNTGQSMKIGPGESAPSIVFDSGAATDLGSPAPANYDGTEPPWTVGTGGKRCFACHTVSKNGERLAGIFERKSVPSSPWGTVDITTDPPSVLHVSAYESTSLFLALSPDGGLVVHNDNNFTLRLANATTGAAIPSALDGYTQVADPSFAPSGRRLVFASDTVGAYPVEYSRSNLDVVDFDPATHAFSNRKKIVDGGGDAIAFPSFSPDSGWVFYQKGDYSRAKYGTSSIGRCNLYMIDAEGQGQQIALDRANGAGVLPAHNLNLNYQPNANPVAVGGYFWIVFFSPRDYGNRMLSSDNPTYQNRKQLWVAAVDVNPQPGADPSHPAFYLRGQDLETINMKGYWALEPCKQEGLDCKDGYQCCTGFCRDQGDGSFKCMPPPSGECSRIGEACKSAADCCQPPGSSIQCIGGFCSLPGPR
jgi:WD40 repeat protein